MNNISSPSRATGPAAEPAMRMEETLDALQASVAEIFAGIPVLVRLLMRLFAMLRDAAARVGSSGVAPEIELPEIVSANVHAACVTARKCDVRGSRAPARGTVAVVARTNVLGPAASAMIHDFEQVLPPLRAGDLPRVDPRRIPEKSFKNAILRTEKTMPISLRYRNVNANG